MFDLPAEIRKVYEEEKQSLKTVINDIYGPSIITEHGRIQACTIEDEVAMSLVCMYGHTVISAPEPNDAISRSSRQILFVCTYGNSQDTSKRVGKNGLFKLGISKIYTGK